MTTMGRNTPSPLLLGKKNKRTNNIYTTRNVYLNSWWLKKTKMTWPLPVHPHEGMLLLVIRASMPSRLAKRIALGCPCWAKATPVLTFLWNQASLLPHSAQIQIPQAGL